MTSVGVFAFHKPGAKDETVMCWDVLALPTKKAKFDHGGKHYATPHRTPAMNFRTLEVYWQRRGCGIH